MEAQMSCPVCTLYLREGVSLQSHLNTHPKEQVIEALVKYYSAVKDGSNSSTVQSTSEQFPNQQTDQSVIESSSSTVPSQQYPCGSSSFTAAVTYQQFMSSNASLGGTVLPQCFSVPAIVATPTGEASQATLMPLFYNPYIIQQQQQQLQFYNSFRTIPQQPITRHILSPSHLFPVAQQFNITAVDHPVSQNTVTVSSSSTALQNSSSVQIVPSSSASSQASNLKNEEKSQINDTLTSGEVKTREMGVREASKESECVQCNEQGTSTEADQEEEVNETDAGDLEMVLPTVYNEEMNDCHATMPSSDRDARSTSSAGTQYSNDAQNKNLCLNDKNVESDESNEVVCIDLENEDSRDASKSVRPNLNVRKNVSATLPEAGGAEQDEEKEEEDQEAGEGEHILADIPFECCGSDPESSIVKENNDEIKYETETSDVKNDESNLEQDSAELIISDICPPEENEIDKQCSHSNNVENNESSTSTQSATGQFNVVDIDGIRILVPSHYIDSTENNQKLVNNQISSREPYTGFSSSASLTEDKETETYPCVNQDIQTDEVMPPMGELSGQESIGENDTNSWSQEKDEVSTSYDLLARESWEASDGSDDENDSMVVDDSVKELEPVVQEQVPKVEIKKEKLKCFYKCWCNEIFTCPKERRVHQSEKHGKKNFSPVKVEKKEWHDPLDNEKSKNDSMKQELKEEVHLKSEEGLLQAVSVELAEHKATSETSDSVALTDQCLKESRTVNELAKDGEAAFKFICSRCECVFASAKSLHRHMRTTHTNPFSCRTCDEKFPSEAEYLAHLKIHPLECSRCGKYFYRHQNLNLHIRRHLGIKPYKCTICDKAFVTKQKLAEHTNTHTGNTPIKCNLCSETFRRYSNLIQHRNRHHLKLKKKIKDYICHCGEIFHSQKKLQWHKEIHDEKPKTCNYCSERFVHASSLTRHIRKAHDQRYFPCRGRENENVECPVCGCIFLKSSLPVHMRLHSGERPFNCHICGKNFSTKWNLQLHRWTHASRSMKPYKCTLCKSAFIRHSEYTSHMHSHRNVRPYTCNYCGSQFIRKYNCIRHAREHEGEKAFSCEICQKAFHRRYYLKEHMRIHSGVRPFTCHICGKTSSTKSNHNKHVKIHHAREAVNTEG